MSLHLEEELFLLGRISVSCSGLVGVPAACEALRLLQEAAFLDLMA